MDFSHGRQVRCAVCGTTSTAYKDKATDRVYCPVCQFPVEPDGPIPLDDLRIGRFIEQVTGSPLILFWAPWDHSSGEVYLLLAKESQKIGTSRVVAAVNVAENPESKRQYGIEILPTIVIFSFGREINRVVGPVTSFELSRLIRQDHF
ncbi:hypothetical protein JXA80_08315 [bacterium]|nr:hypothetical protein [candidate division CSSED10-310 bacterium]